MSFNATYYKNKLCYLNLKHMQMLRFAHVFNHAELPGSRFRAVKMNRIKQNETKQKNRSKKKENKSEFVDCYLNHLKQKNLVQYHC